MANTDPKTEQLHETASGHYLQGDFDGALAAWRELLARSPGDERAQEGIRLCEMLAGEPTSAPSAAPAPAAAAPTPAAADPAPSFDIAAPVETDRPEVVAAPPADPAEEGFDFDFTEIDGEAPPASVGDEEAATSATAASELANRTRELVEEASRAYEQGRRDEALSLIQRVFILDENNETATTLQEIINAEVDAEQVEELPSAAVTATPPEPPPPPPPAPPAPEAATAGPSFAEPAPAAAPTATMNHEPLADSGPAGSLELDLSGPPSDLAEGSGVDGEALEEIDLPELPDGDLNESDELSLPEPLPLPTRKAGISKWAIAAVAAVLVVGGGAYVAFGFLGGDASGDAVSTEPLPTPEPTPELPPEITGQAEPLPAVAFDSAQLETLLEHGQQSFDGADYAAAVLSYGQAVKLDPTNTEARRQLEAAGELYRQQKESMQKWHQAIESFNQGDYRTALQVFYRLPVSDEEATRVAGYKRNAWYNMGVQALRSGDCVRAREHFGESDLADPGHAAVKAALNLAGRCGGPGDRTYFREVDAMGYRGLED